MQTYAELQQSLLLMDLPWPCQMTALKPALIRHFSVSAYAEILVEMAQKMTLIN